MIIAEHRQNYAKSVLLGGLCPNKESCIPVDGAIPRGASLPTPYARTTSGKFPCHSHPVENSQPRWGSSSQHLDCSCRALEFVLVSARLRHVRARQTLLDELRACSCYCSIRARVSAPSTDLGDGLVCWAESTVGLGRSRSVTGSGVGLARRPIIARPATIWIRGGCGCGWHQDSFVAISSLFPAEAGCV